MRPRRERAQRRPPGEDSWRTRTYPLLLDEATGTRWCAASIFKLPEHAHVLLLRRRGGQREDPLTTSSERLITFRG